MTEERKRPSPNENDSNQPPLKKARPVKRMGQRPPKEAKPLPPSPKQPILDHYYQLIKTDVHPEAIEESYINRMGQHVPTLVVKNNHWRKVATYLKNNLDFCYIQNYAGVDYQTHMEVVCHLYSFSRNEQIAIRIKADHEQPTFPSLTSLFAAANWNEREMYDLLGFHFEGHPNLTRILLPEHWEGHPLRKDYEPIDKEV